MLLEAKKKIYWAISMVLFSQQENDVHLIDYCSIRKFPDDNLIKICC